MPITVPLIFYIGYWFGDRQVYIESISPTVVMHAENVSTNPAKLAVNLLTCLFTPEQLATGNCTKPNRQDIELLDQKMVQAIRGKLQLMIKSPNIYDSLSFYVYSSCPIPFPY